MSRHLHRCTTKFARTADEAFNTPRYASAVEHYRSPSYGLAWWATFGVVSLVALCLIGWTA
jgi:hypothetical protein